MAKTCALWFTLYSVSEAPFDTEPKPKHAGGRPPGSRDKFPRKSPRKEPVVLPPEWEVRVERPWHQYAAYLFASGKSITAIALQLGKEHKSIANLWRQPWFKQKVDDLIAERGMDVLDALKAVQHKAVAALERIIDDPGSTSAAVVAAADSILDRVHGKPTVRVESMVMHSEDPVAEHDRLLREVQQLSRETERGLLPHSSSNGQSSTPHAEETIQEDKGQAPIPGNVVPAQRDDGRDDEDTIRTYPG